MQSLILWNKIFWRYRLHKPDTLQAFYGKKFKVQDPKNEKNNHEMCTN